jgi:uncharacterized protein with HEPN domain
MSSANRTWKHGARHMLQAAERILSYCAGVTEEGFRADQQLLDAVVWNLTVLGEAAKNVPVKVEGQFPELPWAEMRGIRNRVVHGYDEIDVAIIWNVVHIELPPLVPLVRRLIQEGKE